MSKLFVKDIKVGVSNGGIACGPVSGHPVVEVCIHDADDNSAVYHCLVEVENTLNFFTSSVSNYDIQIDDDCDEETWDAVSETASGDYYDYSEFFDEFYALPEEEQCSDQNLIRRLLIALVRADWDETALLVKAAEGKALREITIPMSDMEEEYLEEMEDED